MGIGGRAAVQRSACRNRKLLAGGWPARMVGTPHRVEVPIQETCRVRRSPPSRPTTLAVRVQVRSAFPDHPARG